MKTAVAAALMALPLKAIMLGAYEWEVFSGSTLTAGLPGETLGTHSMSGATTLVDRRSSFLQPSLPAHAAVAAAAVSRQRGAHHPQPAHLGPDRAHGDPQGRNSIVNPDTVGNPHPRPRRPGRWTPGWSDGCRRTGRVA
ncbi:MAG: hypothetical protein JWP65_3341 [Ramlibacter sp.]|uniref:hypothetical protein n=1 Tax=Ramlibacter sp. TaxID=1917967 RepID=UPI002636BA64|nr:hypothetical protein [Ramlibacter sp.]MDB5752920.1 hypothetical protein [Ramlibacter sp.]